MKNRRLRIRIALSMGIALLPSWAWAQSDLERFEALSEKFATVVYEKMIDEIAANGGQTAGLREAIPDTSWDDSFRNAGACILEAYEKGSSAQAVNRMLSDMESLLPKVADASLDQMDQFDAARPDGIGEDQAADINEQCGMLKLQQQRMFESGFMKAMMSATQGG